MLRSIFMGTPAFALPSFEVVRAVTDLRLVVTQPDRPAGRGRTLRPPPVKDRAVAAGVEVAQPEGALSRELGDRLEAIAPDIVVVAAFGKIIGRRVLRLPRLGCINVHASILPRHRGASPVAWAIRSGDVETGITIQKMVLEMDAGDVLVQRRTPIDPDETTGDLMSRLAGIGAESLREAIAATEAGTLAPSPQDTALATFAPPLSKLDGAIDWSRDARQVHDHVRAMNPWPVAYTTCRDARLLVKRTRVASIGPSEAAPGSVVRADCGGVVVACGTGSVEVLEAQREGRSPLATTQLVCGRVLSICDLLGR
jgi:methionyl-tRNA formyltransferase